MDPKSKRWNEVISIGMPAIGWLVVHGMVTVALRHPRTPRGIKGVGKRLLTAIEDVLHKKGLFTASDVMRVRKEMEEFKR